MQQPRSLITLLARVKVLFLVKLLFLLPMLTVLLDIITHARSLLAVHEVSIRTMDDEEKTIIKIGLAAEICMHQQVTKRVHFSRPRLLAQYEYKTNTLKHSDDPSV